VNEQATEEVAEPPYQRENSDPFATNFEQPQMQNQIVYKRVLDHIEEHFTLKIRPQIDSPEQIDALLKNRDQMESLLDYLRYENELAEAELEPIKKHFGLAQEIKEAEEKKK
jgi:hypothetical protein